MKKYILSLAFATMLAVGASAEVLKITFTNGTTQTYKVEEVSEITFEEESPAAQYAGSYTGNNAVVVGGNFTYNASGVTYTITANEDGTINLSVPEYSLANTIMGDLTLGAYTVSNIAFDEAKNGFYRAYASESANDNLQMHFLAVNDGNTVFDKDYEFKSPSNVLIEKTDAGLKITNNFILGNMPFPIVVTFAEVAE